MYIVKGSSLLSSCAKVMPSIIDINGCLFSAIFLDDAEGKVQFGDGILSSLICRGTSPCA